MKRVEWCEARNGQTYFVIADLAVEGWSFAERSTYETCWCKIPATEERIARANHLSSHESMKAPARRPTYALVEMGDYSDNAAVLSVANWKISNGEIADGVTMLSALRHHIVQTRDHQSRQWLLPVIERALEAAAVGARPTSRSSDELLSPAPTCNLPPSEEDRAQSFKARLINAAIIVATLAYTHGLMVHELMKLPGVDQNVLAANIAAGSALLLAFRFVSRDQRAK